MDNICVKTNKLRQLEQIGKLSANHLCESEEYVKLAMNVEHFLKTESPEVLEIIKKQLAICINKFPEFNQIKNNLMVELLGIGYLASNDTVKAEHIPTKEEILPTTTTSPSQSNFSKSNIVSLFKNKKDNS